MYRIYYLDDRTYTGGGGDHVSIQDVLLVLQQYPDGQWVTEYGGDFYVWQWERWVCKQEIGLKRWLQEQDLLRPRIGDRHEVFVDGEWVLVDHMGFLEWLEQERHVLIGQMTTDEHWNQLMAKVQHDKTFAEEYGYLPD